MGVLFSPTRRSLSGCFFQVFANSFLVLVLNPTTAAFFTGNGLHAGCTFWGVTTTIFEPSAAIHQFTASFENVCLVVVGDRKSNQSAWREYIMGASLEQRVMFLSDDQQQVLSYGIAEHLPWNHFGRKNIGYLYAISNRATVVYDFDDDNHLLQDRISFFGNMAQGHESLSALVVDTDYFLYNPYPDFAPVDRGGRPIFAWPRGFPLGFVQESKSFSRSASLLLSPNADVAIFQSLADNDPDVDAIFRLTSSLPLTFSVRDQVRVIPHSTFCPWNAQAVVIKPPAFWAMLLPITVDGRVSDIWRSYLSQRLLWETDYYLAFTSPFVVQYRNPHSYIQDFNVEIPLYTQTERFLRVLAGFFSPVEEELSSAYVRIMEALVLEGLLGASDLKLASSWVEDLRQVGYVWPAHRHQSVPFAIPTVPVQDFRQTEVLKDGSHSIHATADKLPENETAPSALPVHLFEIDGGGTVLESFNGSQFECQSGCSKDFVCEAWSMSPTGTCTLFSRRANRTFSVRRSKQGSSVGILQRRAAVFRPWLAHASNFSSLRKDRVLYVMNFHWPTSRQNALVILQNWTLRCVLKYTDIILIAPKPVVMDDVYETLCNPFTENGKMSQLSLPLARSRFPGYKGYFLINDDAVIQQWLFQKQGPQFDEMFMGTFHLSSFQPEIFRKPTKASWPWWKMYSRQSRRFREWVCEEQFRSLLLAEQRHKFCNFSLPHIPSHVAQADVFYVPESDAGKNVMQLLVMTVEEDVFLEVAVPWAFSLAVESNNFIPLTLCTKFGPVRKTPWRYYNESMCNILHPVKASKKEHVLWWKEVLREKCGEGQDQADIVYLHDKKLFSVQ